MSIWICSSRRTIPFGSLGFFANVPAFLLVFVLLRRVPVHGGRAAVQLQLVVAEAVLHVQTLLLMLTAL